MMFREITVVKRNGPVTAEDYSFLTKEALKFVSDVMIEYNRATVNAKSVMGVLALGLRDGEKVTVVVKGTDEDLALDEICRILHGGWRR